MAHPIEELKQIMQQLRNPQSGCPWDKKQDFDSIVPYTIEETYEVVDAIHNQDWPNLREELGDLLFQVIFYSQLAKEQNLFDFDDVVREVNEKLTRRHPHVFADSHFETQEQLNANWEKQKAAEKICAGKTSESILDSVPASLPALMRAAKIQKKCARVGFDWDALPPVVDKVREELDEVLAEVDNDVTDSAAVEMELGDLLFAVVNLVRHLGHDPESALAKANLKFIKRFRGVEKLASADGKGLRDHDLATLDAFWNQVKHQEKEI